MPRAPVEEVQQLHRARERFFAMVNHEVRNEAIFDIYVTKNVGERRGMSLGLPHSRRLARLLGGELRVISRPNRGGDFELGLLGRTASVKKLNEAFQKPFN